MTARRKADAGSGADVPGRLGGRPGRRFGRMQWLPRGKLSDLAPQGAEIWLDGVTIRVPASSLPKRLQNRESGLHGRCF